MNSGELQDLLLRCEASTCRNCSSTRNCWSKLKAWPLHFCETPGVCIGVALQAPYTTPYMLALFLDVVKGVRAFHEQTGYLHADLKSGALKKQPLKSEAAGGLKVALAFELRPENVMINCGLDESYSGCLLFWGMSFRPMSTEFQPNGMCGRKYASEVRLTAASRRSSTWVWLAIPESLANAAAAALPGMLPLRHQKGRGLLLRVSFALVLFCQVSGRWSDSICLSCRRLVPLKKICTMPPQNSIWVARPEP